MFLLETCLVLLNNGVESSCKTQGQPQKHTFRNFGVIEESKADIGQEHILDRSRHIYHNGTPCGTNRQNRKCENNSCGAASSKHKRKGVSIVGEVIVGELLVVRCDHTVVDEGDEEADAREEEVDVKGAEFFVGVQTLHVHIQRRL